MFLVGIGLARIFHWASLLHKSCDGSITPERLLAIMDASTTSRLLKLPVFVNTQTRIYHARFACQDFGSLPSIHKSNEPSRIRCGIAASM